MLCEKCKSNNASVHYRYNDNGKVTETHLCAECAKASGLLFDNSSVSSGFMSDKNGFGDNFTKIPFSSLFGGNYYMKPQSTVLRVCPGCGMTENEFRNSGKLGCERCYSVFSDLVEVLLKKMHLSTEYKGKIPSGRNEALSAKRKIEKLKDDMQRAVENQEYEQAAKIRDMIKALENDEEKIDPDNDGGDRK